VRILKQIQARQQLTRVFLGEEIKPNTAASTREQKHKKQLDQ
jgi:hypothetical protein